VGAFVNAIGNLAQKPICLRSTVGVRCVGPIGVGIDYSGRLVGFRAVQRSGIVGQKVRKSGVRPIWIGLRNCVSVARHATTLMLSDENLRNDRGRNARNLKTVILVVSGVRSAAVSAVSAVPVRWSVSGMRLRDGFVNVTGKRARQLTVRSWTGVERGEPDGQSVGESVGSA
jgi:hypothetical protein